MEQTTGDKIFFINSIHDFDFKKRDDYVFHILCLEGIISFIFHGVKYNVTMGHYIILSNFSLASSFMESVNFKGIIIVFSESYFTPRSLHSNFGVLGYLSMIENPVVKLSDNDFEKCRLDMLHIRERLEDTELFFRKEIVEHLMSVHILDIYAIHARKKYQPQIPERSRDILRQFIEMLYQGEHIQHRELLYYASAISVPTYILSATCRKVSGKSASYWIDRFILHDIILLLNQKELPLSEIVQRLYLSSPAYFGRYVQKHLGISPSDYRYSIESPEWWITTKQ